MRKFALTLAVAAAAMALSACGSIDLTKKNAEPAAEAPAAAAPSSEAAPSPSKAAPVKGLKVVADATLGKVVTDWQGWTLYRFEKDTPKPSKSNCAADCLAKWPYVPYVEGQKTEGVDVKLVGKLTRADGGLQLTINGWPAYRYSGDAKAGETKGQGVGNVWYAFTPEGKKAQAVVADNTGGGY